MNCPECKIQMAYSSIKEKYYCWKCTKEYAESTSIFPPKKPISEQPHTPYANGYVKGWNEAIDICREYMEKVIEEYKITYFCECDNQPDKTKSSYPEAPRPKDIIWQENYAKEFHKHYEGILPDNVIYESVQWNLKFMEKYMKSPLQGQGLDKKMIKELLLNHKLTYLPELLKSTSGVVDIDEAIGVFELICAKFGTPPRTVMSEEKIYEIVCKTVTGKLIGAHNPGDKGIYANGGNCLQIAQAIHSALTKDGGE